MKVSLGPLRMAGYVMLAIVACSIRANSDTPAGFLEGHLKIAAPREVELAGGNPTASPPYPEYPLIVRSQSDRKEVARFTADEHGNYRTALPPGDYILDVQGRAPGHVRAKPQPFSIGSNQTVRVDMDIDTGVR